MKKAMAFAALFMAMAAIAAGPVTLTAKDGKSSQHETLQAAIDAAGDGETIKLESDLVLKKPTHEPTIGLLVCKTKDNTMVKWALESLQQPIGVSEYRISEILPKEIASDLPSIADIESAVDGVS